MCVCVRVHKCVYSMSEHIYACGGWVSGCWVKPLTSGSSSSASFVICTWLYACMEWQRVYTCVCTFNVYTVCESMSCAHVLRDVCECVCDICGHMCVGVSHICFMKHSNIPQTGWATFLNWEWLRKWEELQALIGSVLLNITKHLIWIWENPCIYENQPGQIPRLSWWAWFGWGLWPHEFLLQSSKLAVKLQGTTVLNRSRDTA